MNKIKEKVLKELGYTINESSKETPHIEVIDKTLKEVVDVIDELKNPYPEDIFPKVELSKTGTEKVSRFFGREISISLDRFSASLMRKARENVKEEIKFALSREGEQ